MSPNVGNFVHDLVEMAKAMETLPQVQAELDRANTLIENYANQVQNREIAIISYKQEIEDLHAKVRSLEVERDDASFRVLEAEDMANSALILVRTASVDLSIAIMKLDPPKPEPVKEPEPVATPAEGQSASDPTAETAPMAEFPTSTAQSAQSSTVPDAIHSISETSQSESNPTTMNPDAGGQASEGSQSVTTAINSDTAMASYGPYYGKLYNDNPTYVPLQDWISGGGTEEDYYYRPTPSVGDRS